ncbi:MULTISPECIES: hypothetical protein [Comamonas]|uniref:Uncharacterized protein n=1 Tax=Comamonas thiooxydans TaxID=363952 RepID=A0A0E3B9L4_9BURK|nr:MULTISPECIES: hypothetical protein [Comamonas]KGG86021.1 hypothetical protein P245_22410 [Comamonas thiooxydans]MDH1332766.1 hypothetical protein [Comamonas thiooxydans]MDH1739778.1 hypothetical protein [Comamonas thiooxydans]MDH1785193.1 hypothetical protein [Comamonas thiooxydans]QOQ82372.1 hypothetical protein INP81_24240 [Comamonas thiooxydans]
MSAPDHSGFAPHTVTAKPDIFSHAVHVIGPEGNKRNKAPATALKQLGARAQKRRPAHITLNTFRETGDYHSVAPLMQ